MIIMMQEIPQKHYKKAYEKYTRVKITASIIPPQSKNFNCII